MRTLKIFLMLLVLVAGFVVTKMSLAAYQPQSVPGFDCGHFSTWTLPHTSPQGEEAVGLWVSGDPMFLESVAMSVTLDMRAVISATSSITISNVPITNTYGCYMTIPLTQDHVAELINGQLPAYWVKVDEVGLITYTMWSEPVPTLTPTNTPTPSETPVPATATASPTATVEPTNTPALTLTPTATQTPLVSGVYLPLVFKGSLVFIPAPTSTPSPTSTPVTTITPYQELDCGQYMEMDLASRGASGVWTTTDPVTVTVGAGNYFIDARALIVSYHDYSLTSADNTWSCYFVGEMPIGRRNELLAPILPAYWLRINTEGVLTWDFFTEPWVTTTPPAIVTPYIP